MDSGRDGEAVAQFEEAARLTPESPEVGYLLGRAYARTGQLTRAKEALERALQQARASGDAELARDIEEAINACQRLLRQIP